MNIRSRPRRTRARAAASRPRGAEPPRHSAHAVRALDAVRRIVRALRVAEQRTRAEAGLTAAQLFVLGQLSSAPALSLTELAGRTMTDRSSVASVLERLEEMGLVRTDRDPADRRRVVAHITASGRRRLSAAPRAPTSLLVDALDAMPATQVSTLAAQLELLVAAMGLDSTHADMLFEDAGAAKPSPRSGARRGG